jgi:hypothetical protein
MRSALFPRVLHSNVPNRVGAPKKHWLPQVILATEQILSEATHHSKLPKQHQHNIYHIRNLRSIATDRKLWKSLVAPTHGRGPFKFLIEPDTNDSAG